jgi:hypothetical protein
VVTISWDAVSDATSYNIYWSTTSGVTKINGTKITGATNPYSHTGLTNQTKYYYIVTAVNSAGESAESTEASATPPLAGWYGTHLNIGLSYPEGKGYNLYANDTEIFAATSNGLFSTTDNGNNWVSKGLTGISISDVIISNQYILAAVGAIEDLTSTESSGPGVYRSSDNGNAWLPADGLTDKSVLGFAKNSSYLFAVTRGYGVFRSNDDGATWQLIGLNAASVWTPPVWTGPPAPFPPPSTITMKDVALASGSIYAVGETIFTGFSGYIEENHAGVCFSTDNGDTWQFHDLPYPWTIPWCFYYDNGVLYAGGFGLYSSPDLGNTWQLKAFVDFDSKTGAAHTNGMVRDIISYNNALMASFQFDDICLSRDNGTSWTKFNDNLVSGWSLASLAIKPPYIWALRLEYGNAYRRPLTDIVP